MRARLLFLFASCLAVALGAPAGAQTTSDHGASLLLFPKVVTDGSGDTILQVANLLESRVDVLCTYVDPSGGSATSFTLDLVAEQPLGISAPGPLAVRWDLAHTQLILLQPAGAGGIDARVLRFDDAPGPREVRP